MKSELKCLTCLIKQAYNTVQLATSDKTLQKEVIYRTAQWIREADLDQSPAAISTPIYRIVSEVTGNKDPYNEIKKQTNQDALHLIPELEMMIANVKDPLDTGLHLAVAGNIIDLGIGHDFDLKTDIKEIMKIPFTINDTKYFREEIKPDRKLLYLGDNSGEIVFDRLLIEILLDKGMDITYVVKSGPIINDAMIEDAKTAGITDLVCVIETGSGDIGIRLENISRELRDGLENSDVIIAKGHGNFESCNEIPYNLYFLLKTKCSVVADALGVETGDIVFKHYRNIKD
jgi:uncharacterized protein with ATP-grasp and redox domains